jgi:hypothetical protein
MNWLQQISEWLARASFWYTVRPWEEAIRVRCGQWLRVVGPGIHLRLPLFDQIFAQNTRERVLNLPIQTVTTSRGEAITFSVVVRWRICDVRLIYETVHTPEDWIFNIVLAATSEAIYNAPVGYTPKTIGVAATDEIAKLLTHGRGIEICSVSMIDFAKVRTYRLISGDGNTGWTWNRVGALDTTTH